MKIMTTVNALFLFCAASVVAQAQPGHWKMFDRRLGMFVHWGS